MFENCKDELLMKFFRIFWTSLELWISSLAHAVLLEWLNFPTMLQDFATRATSKRSLSFVIKKSAASPLNITTDLRWVSKQLPPWPSDARTIHELQPWGWRRNDHTGCCGYHIHYKLRFSKLKTTNLSILSFLFFSKKN